MVEHRHKECKKNCKKCTQQIQEIHQKTLPFYKKQKTHQNLIGMSKLSFHKKQTEYLNQSRDATQFWHGYEKVIDRKTNNTVEPIFDSNSSTHIFDDEVISNRLHGIAKSASYLNYNDSFKMHVEEKLQKILNHIECD